MSSNYTKKELDDLKFLLSANGIHFTERNEKRILKRITLTAKRKKQKTMNAYINFLKNNDSELKSLVRWLSKGLIYDRGTKMFLPLVEGKTPINNGVVNKKRIEKHGSKTKTTIASEPLSIDNAIAFQSLFKEPTDLKNLELIFQFLDQKKINYQAYKRNYFKRRLLARVRKSGCDTYNSYLEILQKDSSEIPKLIDNLSINVTHFFRDIEMYDELARNIFPLVSTPNSKKVKIWSAGCASGAEPYSIAMLVHRKYGQTGLNKFTILASDLSNDRLTEARTAVYDPEYVEKEAIDPWVYTYFSKTSNGHYKVLENIKRAITLVQHDLRQPPPTIAKELDIIICRNVLIYFSKEQSESLFNRFLSILKKGGIIILGKCELIPYSIRSSFKVIDAKNRIYQKIVE